MAWLFLCHVFPGLEGKAEQEQGSSEGVLEQEQANGQACQIRAKAEPQAEVGPPETDGQPQAGGMGVPNQLKAECNFTEETNKDEADDHEKEEKEHSTVKLPVKPKHSEVLESFGSGGSEGSGSKDEGGDAVVRRAGLCLPNGALDKPDQPSGSARSSTAPGLTPGLELGLCFVCLYSSHLEVGRAQSVIH